MGIKEISRRCDLVDIGEQDEYVASIIAEITVEVDGKIYYLVSLWNEETPGYVAFDIADEETYEQYINGEAIGISEINNGDAKERFMNQFSALLEMIRKKLLETKIYKESDIEEFYNEW